MSDPDDVLARWQDGELSAADVAALKALLGDAAQRAALVREAHDRAAIIETLRAEDAAARTPAGPATARMRVVGATIDAQEGGDGSTSGARARRPRGAPRLHRRARGLRAGPVGAAIAAVLVVCAASWYLRAPAPTRPPRAALAVVIASDGAVLVGADEVPSAPQACTPGMTVRADDRLDATGGALRLRFADEATELDLARGGRLSLREVPGRREVRLETGAVAADVAKQPAGRALVFITDQAEAWVVGTRLSVTADAGATRLEVSEGRVRFQARAGGAPLDVSAAGAATATAAGLRRDGPAPQSASLLPARGCLWGASLRAEAGAAPALSELETASGRSLAVVHQYQAFPDYARERPFPSAAQRAWAAGGRLLAIAWKPRIGEEQLRWADVADGAYDAAYVDVLARKAAAWGQSFFLTIHHDPEEAIGPAGSGMTAGDFVRMWRHLHARFAAAGATRVAWVWTVSGAAAMAATWNDLYPGDDCVDWLACAAYNNAHPPAQAEPAPMPWRSFSELVAPFVGWARGPFRGDHAKPLMVAVCACAEDPADPGRKAAWLRTLPEQLRQLPEIRAVLYFHDRALRADSTPAALAGFRAAGADPLFQTASPTSTPQQPPAP